MSFLSRPSRNVRHGHFHVKHPKYKKRSDYSSKARGNPRIKQAINYLRYKYHVGMHDIARIVQVSTRTVHRTLAFRRAVTKKGFDLAHRRRKHEVKIVNEEGRVIDLKTLTALCQSFINGIFGSIREALGDEPP